MPYFVVINFSCSKIEVQIRLIGSVTGAMYDGSRWSLVIFVICQYFICVATYTIFLWEENNNMGKTEDALRALVCQKQKQNACACRYQAHVCHGNVAHHRRPPNRTLCHLVFRKRGRPWGSVFDCNDPPPNVLMIRKCITSVKLNLKTEK